MGEDKKKDPDKMGPPTFAGEDVRQGEIILKRRWQRLIFIGGLVVVVLAMLFLQFAR